MADMTTIHKTVYEVKEDHRGQKSWFVKSSLSNDLSPGDGPFYHGMPYPAVDLPIGSTHESSVECPTSLL